MKNRKIKKTFIIPLLLGLVLLLAGIIYIIIAVSTPYNSLNFGFLIPLFFGLGGFMIVFVTPIVFAISNNQKPEENVTDNSFYDAFKDLAKKVKKVNEKQCKYCGATLNLDETKCPNCGAKDID